VEFPEARIFEETLNMFLFENRTGPDVDLLQATASRTGVTMSSSTAACVSDEEDDRRADPLQALYEGLIDGRLNLQNFCKDQVLKDIKPVFDKQKEELSVDETNSQNLDALLRFGWHKSEFPTRRDSVYGKDIYYDLHTLKRPERHWAGLLSDLVMEQKFMRSLKIYGGLTGGAFLISV
ncbi:hypothetical protein QYM36_018520, partial [Artemia franciscana]